MATLQRHWRFVTLFSCILLLAGTWGWLSVREHAVLADPPAPAALSAVAHDAIVEILEHISLDRDSLIGLNLTSQQAASVLTAVRTWYEEHVSQLVALHGDIDSAAMAVQAVERAIAMGPAQEGRDEDLASARQQLHTAQEAYVAALSPLRASVAAVLSASQNTTWSAIAASYGPQMPLRLLSLTSQQRLDLGRAHRHYQWQHAAATTQEQRSAAASAWESALSVVLTVEQRQVLEAFKSYQAASSQAVAEAFDTVLALAQS